MALIYSVLWIVSTVSCPVLLVTLVVLYPSCLLKDKSNPPPDPGLQEQQSISNLFEVPNKGFLWTYSSQSGTGVFRRHGLRVFIQLCSVCIMFLKTVFESLREHDCFENFTGCAPLWSAYFGRSENMALESSDMTGWALTSGFRYSPTAPRKCVYVLNSALNLGQCSVGILTFHNDKWQGL